MWKKVMRFFIKLSINILGFIVYRKTSTDICVYSYTHTHIYIIRINIYIYIILILYTDMFRSAWVNILSLFTFLGEKELEFYILMLPQRFIFWVHHLILQTTDTLFQSNLIADCNTFDVVVSLRWRHWLNKISLRGSQLVLSESPNKSQRGIL